MWIAALRPLAAGLSAVGKEAFTHKASRLTASIGTVALNSRSMVAYVQTTQKTTITKVDYCHNNKDRNVPVISNHIEVLGTGILLHRLMKTSI